MTAYRWLKEGRLPVPARKVGRLILVEPEAAEVRGQAAVSAPDSSADPKPDLDRQVARVTAGATKRGRSVCVARAGRRMALANAAGLLAGYGLDRLLGDPRRGHPVAGYGRVAAVLEQALYAPRRRAGVRYAAIAVGGPVALAAAADGATRHRPMLRAGLVAATTWAVLGARSLRDEAAAMAAALEDCDLPAARARLPHLCGRDPSMLDEPELARATVESVAENNSDAVVAPLFWGGLAGLPGLVGYRAVNTLDAMVGHRSDRYARFGTAAARLDDLANLLPSRLTAAFTVALAPLVAGDRWRAARTWLRDGHRHPSPNAGQCESAMAGALGVRLGGRNVYSGRVEVRPHLGDGPRPGTPDIRRAVTLAAAAGAAGLGLAAGAAALGLGSRAVGLGLAAGGAAPRLRHAVFPSHRRRGGRG